MQHRRVTVGDLGVHVVTAGEGPPVLLLHGFPECWWAWRYQLAPLVRAGYRVIAPDLRGFGQTDAHGPTDLDTLAGDVAGLLDALEVFEPVRLVGHDWGGALTFHLLSTHAARFSHACVVNGPHPQVLRRALLGGSLRQLLRSWYMFFFLLPWLPEWLFTRGEGALVGQAIRGSSVDVTRLSDVELTPQRSGFTRPGAARTALNWYRSALWEGLRGRGPGARRYAPIDTPVHMLWGLDDATLRFDDIVLPTRAFVPNLEVVTLPRCGHFAPADAPAVVTGALLDWLAGTR